MSCMAKKCLKIGGLTAALGGAVFTASFAFYAGQGVANKMFNGPAIVKTNNQAEGALISPLASKLSTMTEAEISAKKKEIAKVASAGGDTIDEVVRQTVSHLPGAEQTMKALRDNRIKMENMVGTQAEIKERSERLEDIANRLLNAQGGSAPQVTPVDDKPVAKLSGTSNVSQDEKPMTLSLGKDIDGNDLGVKGRVLQLQALAKDLNDDFTVNYPAKGVEKDQLFVFTDPTCPYCQKLHRDIPKLQEQGYTVRYLYFPRVGVKPSVLKSKMEATWCSPNAPMAVNEMFEGLPIASQDCSNLTEDQKKYGNIVEQHFVLAKILNVQYTPTVFTSKGVITEGYSNLSSFKMKLGLE